MTLTGWHVLALALLFAGCPDETCQTCVERCAPFVVSKCEPIRSDGVRVACECEVSK